MVEAHDVGPSEVKRVLLASAMSAFAENGYIRRSKNGVRLVLRSFRNALGSSDLEQFRSICRKAIRDYFGQTAK